LNKSKLLTSSKMEYYYNWDTKEINPNGLLVKRIDARREYLKYWLNDNLVDIILTYSNPIYKLVTYASKIL